MERKNFGDYPEKLSPSQLAAAFKAGGHPLRAELLKRLAKGADSPKKLAGELDKPLSNVSYHVRVLADVEAIRLVKTEPRRGSVAHFYAATRLGRRMLKMMGEISET